MRTDFCISQCFRQKEAAYDFPISRNAVKEGFDTLPAAICYFDRNGLLRLINHRMQELAAVLCGCDLQTLTDLEQALHSPGGGVQLRDEAARIYAFPDGTVYHLRCALFRTNTAYRTPR